MANKITLAELVAFLKLSIASAEQALSQLRLDVQDERSQCALILMLALVDHGRSVIALDTAHAYTGIPCIARSALDAYADLANVCDHEDYWEHLEALDAFEWKKSFQAASVGKNPVLEPLRQDANFLLGRRLMAERFAKLEQRGIKKLEVSERFERAGLRNEYESMYSMMSAEAHNNVSQLRSRYLIFENDRVAIRARIQVEPGHSYEMPCTLTIGEIITMSIEKLLRWCGHGTAVVAAASEELARLRELAKQQDLVPQGSA